MKFHSPRFLNNNNKSRWPYLTESELKTVIRSAAVRERNKPRNTRIRHRRKRLEAVEFYREKHGETKFLKQFSSLKLPILENLWLPRGYAYWKVRNVKKT